MRLARNLVAACTLAVLRLPGAYRRARWHSGLVLGVLQLTVCDPVPDFQLDPCVPPTQPSTLVRSNLNP